MRAPSECLMAANEHAVWPVWGPPLSRPGLCFRAASMPAHPCEAPGIRLRRRWRVGLTSEHPPLAPRM